MGWFWAGPVVPATSSGRPVSCPVKHTSTPAASQQPEASSCPMRKRTIDALSSSAPSSGSPAPSTCPVPHAPPPAQQSTLSRLNPLNYMFRDLPQSPAANQTTALPTSRDASSIPKGSRDGNWEYPSPQQMYHALLRKGYTDTDVTAVESMVAVHNFLNEGAWAEIVEWERRFGRGLARGWAVCRRGEENSDVEVRRVERREGRGEEPTLVRFQGRPTDMTPKAAMIQLLGRAWPAKFGTEPPFDRHDWYVARTVDGQQKEVRYVIDYYSGPPEPTGEPVFYLDVRPAVTPTGAAERMIRWGGDIWWRASGGGTESS